MTNEKMGEVYIATCMSEGKSYVGSAYCELNGEKWGHEKRWQRHVIEAKNPNACDKHCRVLNEAINKYGEANFIVIQLGQFPLSELNDWEMSYIEIMNTLYPKGYNLMFGNQKCKESVQRIIAKRMENGYKHNDKTREKISVGQAGNRREKKDRKYNDDTELPKYVTSIRENDKLIGYLVNNYPIGNRQYTSKKFTSSFILSEDNLLLAKVHLNVLIDKYPHNLRDNPNDAKIEKIDLELPQFISEVIENNKVIGYSVSNILDYKNNQYPPKNFKECNEISDNLYDALLYMRKLIKETEDMKFMTTVKPEQNGLKRSNAVDNHLPKHIGVERKNGEIIGYVVNNYPFIDKDGKKKLIKKKFCSKRVPMSEKYKKVVTYLESLKNGIIPEEIN